MKAIAALSIFAVGFGVLYLGLLLFGVTADHLWPIFQGYDIFAQANRIISGVIAIMMCALGAIFGVIGPIAVLTDDAKQKKEETDE